MAEIMEEKKELTPAETAAPASPETPAKKPEKSTADKKKRRRTIRRIVALVIVAALIAGGVTSFTSILFTAAIIGARKGQNLATGITMLSSFYWRPGMLTGTALWMILTWLLLLWPDWHVLGTTAAGTDVMAMVAGLLPWGTCAAFWYLVFAYWRNIRA